MVELRRVFHVSAVTGGGDELRLGCETKDVFADIALLIANISQPIFSNCHPSTPLNFFFGN